MASQLWSGVNSGDEISSTDEVEEIPYRSPPIICISDTDDEDLTYNMDVLVAEEPKRRNPARSNRGAKIFQGFVQVVPGLPYSYMTNVEDQEKKLKKYSVDMATQRCNGDSVRENICPNGSLPVVYDSTESKSEDRSSGAPAEWSMKKEQSEPLNLTLATNSGSSSEHFSPDQEDPENESKDDDEDVIFVGAVGGPETSVKKRASRRRKVNADDNEPRRNPSRSARGARVFKGFTQFFPDEGNYMVDKDERRGRPKGYSPRAPRKQTLKRSCSMDSSEDWNVAQRRTRRQEKKVQAQTVASKPSQPRVRVGGRRRKVVEKVRIGDLQGTVEENLGMLKDSIRDTQKRIELIQVKREFQSALREMFEYQTILTELVKSDS